MKIIFATNNENKLSEIRNILGNNYEVLSLKNIGCNVDIPETGETLEENALLKAEYVAKHYHLSCFAEDTGLMVDALHGEPGVYSARYASMDDSMNADSHDSNANINKLLKEMYDVRERTAHFRTVIALLEKNELTGEFTKHIFDGQINGWISYNHMGDNGFGYDSVFIPKGYSKTFAQMTTDSKNDISHRAIATKKLRKYLTTKFMYFAGRFQFMYKDYSKDKLAKDYRSILLGDVNKILNTPKNNTKSVSLSNDAEYIGPFYFYEEGTSAGDIVKNEFSMVERATDVVFLLDNEACPGTITELVHASFMKKNVFIFYVKTKIDEGEPENEINSKQWYAIKTATIVNEKKTVIRECDSYEEAVNLIINKFR